jgi:eukaryotic-like serine/threonine-protein kinase
MTFQTFVPEEVEAALGRRYSIEAKIAVGGQGTVFRATRTCLQDGTATHDLVALKLHFDSREAMRVEREVTALKHVSHPNLGRLIEYGHCYVADRKSRYIAYEFIEGLTLKQRLKIGGRLLESDVLPIGRDVAAAIAALWSRGIVHGDIKPSNIMLRESGEAVLIDLGILSFVEEEYGTRPLRPVGYFSPERWGTAGYLSPEQARGERLTCASDIFSLGIVLVECLQGWHPTNGNQNALSRGIRASRCRLDASAGLLNVLDKMLSETPRSRGRVTKLSSYFQVLEQRPEEEIARRTIPRQQAKR